MRHASRAWPWPALSLGAGGLSPCGCGRSPLPTFPPFNSTCIHLYESRCAIHGGFGPLPLPSLITPFPVRQNRSSHPPPSRGIQMSFMGTVCCFEKQRESRNLNPLTYFGHFLWFPNLPLCPSRLPPPTGSPGSGELRGPAPPLRPPLLGEVPAAGLRAQARPPVLFLRGDQ